MKRFFILFIVLVGSHLSLTGQDYYRTPSGNRYHLETCRMVENTSHRLTLQEARERGLAPCRICNPMSHGGTIGSNRGAAGQSTQRHQCIGRTQRGTRCRHITRIANSYCYQHRSR